MTTKTRLASWCESVIEAGWLAAVVVTPLFFNIYSSRVFEADKVLLLRSVALVMLTAWLLKAASGAALWLPAPQTTRAPDRATWRLPFAVPVMCLIAAYLLSTAVSVAGHISWWGSFNRLQGTYTLLCFVIVGVLAAAHLRDGAQLARLRHALILTSLPISINAVFQHYGLDPLSSGLTTLDRVTGTAGNPIFLSAYLIMVVFLTLERLLSCVARLAPTGRGPGVADALAAAAWLFILLMQLLAIFWSQSRGPVVGLLAGGYLYVLLTLAIQNGPRIKPFVAGWIACGVLGAGFIVTLNSAPALEPLRTSQQLGRFANLVDSESRTSQVRILVWQGAAQLLRPHAPLTYPGERSDSLNALRPVLGYGPETMAVVYGPFYPTALAHIDARNAIPDRAHNETWDALVITGLAGFLAWQALYIAIFFYSLRWLGLLTSAFDTRLFAAILAAGAVGITACVWLLDDLQGRFLGIAFPGGVLAGLVVYTAIAALKREHRDETEHDAWRKPLIVALLAMICAHYIELQFGIAVVATRLYFVLGTALLLCVGMGWLSTDRPAAETTRAATGVRASLPGTTPIDVLLFWTFVFIFSYNGRGLASATDVLWASVSGRVDSGAHVGTPSVLILMLLTWLVAAVVGMAQQPGTGRSSWSLRGLAGHALVVWGAWLAYALVQGARLIDGADGDTLVTFLAQSGGHYALFTWLVVVWSAAAGARFAWPVLAAPGRVAHQPRLSALAAITLFAGLALILNNFHIGSVRADIAFKHAKRFEHERAWLQSFDLYRQASLARPTNDHYLLFAGRSLLGAARQAREATNGVPAMLPTLASVLTLSPDVAGRMSTSELLHAAEVVFERARQLNPLNVFHTSALAGVHLTRALNSTDAKARHTHLAHSLREAKLAVSQGPNSARLWNELARVYLAARDNNRAEATLAHSLAVDPLFEETYWRLAKLYIDQSRHDEAVDLLDAGVARLSAHARLDPTAMLFQLLSVAHGRLGNVREAIDAAQKIVALQPDNIAAYFSLATLNRQLRNFDIATDWAERGLAIAIRQGAPEAARFRQLLDDLARAPGR